MPERSLVERFVTGSLDVQWYIPGTPQRDFFLGIPEQQKQLVALGKKQLEIYRESFLQLSQKYAENQMALNEIHYQLDGLQNAMHDVGNQIVDAISFLEQSLVAELSEIKWVLGQMDDKLAELVQLIKYPRNTEARELVDDGVKALSRGYFDDAQKCFERALDKKVTDFQAYTNLGFVFLHKNAEINAIDNFTKAVAYAPEEPEAKRQALENLARTYYATKDFANARITRKKAIELPGDKQSASLYRYAIYCVLSKKIEEGLGRIKTLCKDEPAYFAIVSTDPDLDEVKNQLLPMLEYLAVTANKEAKNALLQVEKIINEFQSKSQTFKDSLSEELNFLKEKLAQAKKLLSQNTYTMALKSRQISDNIIENWHSTPPLFEQLESLTRELLKLKSEQKQIEKEFSKYTQELNLKESKSKSIEFITKILVWVIIGISSVLVLFFCKSIAKYIYGLGESLNKWAFSAPDQKNIFEVLILFIPSLVALILSFIVEILSFIVPLLIPVGIIFLGFSIDESIHNMRRKRDWQWKSKYYEPIEKKLEILRKSINLTESIMDGIRKQIKTIFETGKAPIAIDLEALKELQMKTGAGLVESKLALIEAEGDIMKAMGILWNRFIPG